MKFITKKFLLDKNFNIFFFSNRSLFVIKGLFGIFFIKMPSIYYYKCSCANMLSLVFFSLFSFNFFFKHFVNNLIKLSKLFFFRIRIKGLGYRIKKISNNLYRFFFTSTNFFYFHIPFNVLIKYKMRRMLFISNDLVMLKVLIAHLLMLKKIIPYFLRGVFSPRKLIVLKPGKKAF